MAVRGDEPPAAAPSPTPTQSQAAGAAPPPPPTAEADAAADLDPTKIVLGQVRFQHDELGDGNAVDLVLLRRDVAIRRPRSWRPGGRLALLRADLPAGQVRIGRETTSGLGDLYLQALNVRTLNSRLNLATGLAFQLPTATEDVLGSGKWQVAPTVIPVWRLSKRGLFFTRFQDYVSFAGDDDRRDVHYLNVNPSYLKLLANHRFLLLDTEAIADWERDGDVSWKSGLLVGTVLREKLALWVKLEVPWGEHRRSDWTLKTSIAFRGRQ